MKEGRKGGGVKGNVSKTENSKRKELLSLSYFIKTHKREEEEAKWVKKGKRVFGRGRG